MLLHASTQKSWKDLTAAKQALSTRYLAAKPQGVFRAFSMVAGPAPLDNVVGVGIGELLDGDKPTGVIGVKIFVRRKYAVSELLKKELLPKTIEGLPVDVEQIGTVRPLAVRKKQANAAPPPPPPQQQRQSPILNRNSARPGLAAPWDSNFHPRAKKSGWRELSARL